MVCFVSHESLAPKIRSDPPEGLLLCRAMGRPTPELFEAALRVLFYLHHHRHVGLLYEADQLDMTGQSDSDSIGPSNTPRPATSYRSLHKLFMYGITPNVKTELSNLLDTNPQ